VNKLKQVALSDYMQGLRDSSKLVFNEKNAKPAPAADPSAAAPGAAPAGEAPATDSATPSMEANAEMDKPAEAAK
ncbi:MAG: hypothetical protein AB2826_24355, partial [Candidatus Thiodiazotropha sp.]